MKGAGTMGRLKTGRLKSAIAATVLALGLSVSGMALAQVVVVRSTGPSAVSYPPGKRLPAGATVTLRAGDVVTVLDRAGTRVLRGAGSFAMNTLASRDAGSAALLARSLSNPVSVRAGAVRVGLPAQGGEGGQAAEPIPVSIWLADIDQGGRVCLPRGSDLYLWRKASEARRFVWLGESAGGGTVRVALPSRTAGVAWPRAQVELFDGHSYRVAEEGDPNKGVDFEVVMLDPEAVPADAASLGTLLLDNGCKAQFDWLAASLEQLDGAAQG